MHMHKPYLHMQKSDDLHWAQLLSRFVSWCSVYCCVQILRILVPGTCSKRSKFNNGGIQTILESIFTPSINCAQSGVTKGSFSSEGFKLSLLTSFESNQDKTKIAIERFPQHHRFVFANIFVNTFLSYQHFLSTPIMKMTFGQIYHASHGIGENLCNGCLLFCTHGWISQQYQGFLFLMRAWNEGKEIKGKTREKKSSVETTLDHWFITICINIMMSPCEMSSVLLSATARQLPKVKMPAISRIAASSAHPSGAFKVKPRV